MKFPHFALHSAVWKFHDFSVTQILREINFGESRYVDVLKMPFLPILWALHFGNLVDFSLPKSAKIHENQNSKP